MSIPTRIPLTEYNRIVQTNSSPETIVALLNKAESSYSDKPRHWNAKRQYPYWRACPKCGKLFTVANVAELYKKKTCGSSQCRKATGPRPQTRKLLEQRKGRIITCPACGRQVWKANAWIRKVKIPYCSRSCRARANAQHLIPFCGNMKGRKRKDRRYGAANPAWKGGVTYFRKHGNYAPIKYVRCPPEFLPMARKDGYVMEHRLIVARLLGRCLKRTEVVHHKDHNPQNNEPANLELFPSNTAHKKYEVTGKPEPLWRL